MEISELLKFAKENDASDIHLCASLPPILRMEGQLVPLESEPCSSDMVMELLASIMPASQMQQFEEELEVDFAFSVDNLARFRVNAFMQNRGPSAVFRLIPNSIPSIHQLGLPESISQFCDLPRGLVLVTGPTGSGKSSTLAAMIDHINQHQAKHIITIEDPIEFIHSSSKCLINQREVHRDTKSFSVALRSALREDPDIILVGEMRDLTTIKLALTAAETGHLVFGTLHTTSAMQTINRIIDVFPGDEQNLVRSMLSESLKVVISQTLIKKRAKGRIAALEVMLANHAISNLIKEGKIAQIYNMMQTGKDQGMYTLEQHLQQLLEQQLISQEVANSISTKMI